MSSNQSQSPDKSKRFLSPFTAENVFESDIEQIWRNFMKTEKNGHRKTPGILKEKMTSTETTPSTGKFFKLFSLSNCRKRFVFQKQFNGCSAAITNCLGFGKPY